MTKERIEEFGAMFRLITPALLAIIGTLILGNLNEINKKFDGLNTRFDAFLLSQAELEKRVIRLEFRIYGDTRPSP